MHSARWFAIGIALGVALAIPRFSIHVSPATLLEGGSVRVRCRVPPDEANRRLQIALEGYRYSEVPLAGSGGPITTEVTYDHVPCDVEQASCTVLTAMGAQRRITAGLIVICR
jgi:hypothetical protein